MLRRVKPVILCAGRNNLYQPKLKTISLLFVALLCFAPALSAQPQQATTQKVAKLCNQAKENLKKGEYAKALSRSEQVLAIEPDNTLATLIKGQALIGVFANAYTKAYYAGGKRDPPNDAFIPLKQAVEHFERYLQLMPQASDADERRREIEFFRPYAQLAERESSNRTAFIPHELNERKARIIKRAEAQYTEDALKAGVSGSILALAILSSDSTVKNIFVIKQLGYGLTDKVTEAIRKIKFDPATKNGRAISQAVVMEYNFHL